MKTEDMDYIPNVCVVEDDPIMGESLRQRLNFEGFGVNLYNRAQTAYEGLRSNFCDIMLCDVRLPDMTGVDLYRKLLDEKCNVPPTVFITAHGTIEHAVDVLKLGAIDYITKPFKPEDLINKLKSITIIPKKSERDTSECELGVSSSILAIQKHLNNLARYYETPLLITGESGVGKEVVARYLHQKQESSGSFVAVNCSAIPENLIESELFGHEKGAFTGAAKSHKGVFEQAQGGTLLLDEICEMPLFLQAKLLRVLQERAVKRVGGEKDIKISLRLLFATNKDLEEQVRKGLFREDLFYRINVIHAKIPALRNRKDDILWLTERFMEEHHSNYPDTKVTLHESAKHALINHTWPGNIRELKHTIERACIMSNNSTITAHDILETPRKLETAFGTSGLTLKEYLESREKDKISSVLLQNSGCINRSAENLSISRKSLWEKMRKYSIEK